MADEAKSGSIPSNFVEWKFRQKIVDLKNRFGRSKIGQKLGWKQEPQIGKEGAPSEAEIRTELKPEFNLNSQLIARLTQIEQLAWEGFKALIWGKTNSVVFYYRKMSFLTDPEIIELEKRFFRYGTQLASSEEPVKFGPRETDKIVVKKYKLESEKVTYLDDGELFPENISVIGHAKIESIETDWDYQFQSWRQKAEHLDKELGGIWSGIIELDSIFRKSLAKIRERESRFEEKWLGEADKSSRALASLRKKLEELRPRNIRFLHTYKIIAPVIKNPEYNPNHSDQFYRQPTWRFTDFCKKFIRSFKRDDEVEAGLDENGYPLEVYEEGGKWYVLLDKWWSEIAQNEWQKKIITKDGKFEYPAGSGIMYEGKGKKGGKEVWEAKVNNGVLKGGIRRVPKFFVKDLDLLQAAVYMFDELDAVRDDFRTGWAYSYSKTAMDYFLAGEGLSTIFYEGDRTFAPGELRQICGPMPYKMDVAPVIPKEKINLEFDPMKDYIKASPSDFMNVPDDEKRVTREYQMKLNLDDGFSYTLEAGVRKPSQLNPAYDRRALNAKIIDFHWGRMHYYEGKDGINKWPECPFPKASSRGQPKHIAHRLLMELYWDDAVRVGKNSVGWDIGARRPLIGGKFPTDLLGASDLISARRHFESVKEESVSR